MSQPQAVLLSKTGKLTLEELALVATPSGTATHRPVPHHELVNVLIETLGLRHLGVHAGQYAVSKDGANMFGILELDNGDNGIRFALGIRNSHSKQFRLAITVGYKVLVCDNLAFHGDFTPVLAKHSKHLNLVHAVEIGVSEMQRNFAPIVAQVNHWRETQLSDVAAKLVIYRAFIEREIEVPRHLDRRVHDLYFDPQHDDFRPRTAWSLSNAFTSAFKELDPIPQYQATAKLAGFLAAV